MEKPKRTRRRRVAPGEPRLTSPLPDAPPLWCDVDGVDGVCTFRDTQHQQQRVHINNVARFVTWAFKVIGARRLIEQHGVDVVQSVALELSDAVLDGLLDGINNRGGFFVWTVRERSKGAPAILNKGELHIVDEPDAETGT